MSGRNRRRDPNSPWPAVAVLAGVLLVLIGSPVVFSLLTTARIHDPALTAFQRELGEEFPEVCALEVSVRRPSADFEIYVRSDGHLDEIQARTAEFIAESGVFETVLKPQFRTPFIWATRVTVRIYQRNGLFPVLLREYESAGGQQSWEELTGKDFTRWRITRGESLPG